MGGRPSRAEGSQGDYWRGITSASSNKGRSRTAETSIVQVWQETEWPRNNHFEKRESILVWYQRRGVQFSNIKVQTDYSNPLSPTSTVHITGMDPKGPLGESVFLDWMLGSSATDTLKSLHIQVYSVVMVLLAVSHNAPREINRQAVNVSREVDLLLPEPTRCLYETDFDPTQRFHA